MMRVTRCRINQTMQLYSHLKSMHRISITTTASATPKKHDKQLNNVAFISPVWPERSSSAAGVRTMDLISLFADRCQSLTYISTSDIDNDHARTLQASGIHIHHCPPNRESQITDILKQCRPDIVIFDRFYCEEMFSHHVFKTCSDDALRVIDMQDVHFLRQSRQELSKKAFNNNNRSSTTREILRHRPDASYQPCLREIAAVYRSDLTLVCSPVELHMLHHEYGIPMNKMILAPFFVDRQGEHTTMVHDDFASRHNFMMIGNFLHPPNVDSVQWTCEEIWPRITAKLREGSLQGQLPSLHVYGAYLPDRIVQKYHDPKNGIHIKGFLPSLSDMRHYRVCLAALRYGAGLKGKICDAWSHGLVVCTTPIGEEGMNTSYLAHDGSSNHSTTWGGLHTSWTADDIAKDAVRLYSDQALFMQCQQRGFELLDLLYNREKGLDAVYDGIMHAFKEKSERRKKDYIGAILWEQKNRSTEYFSRWIELKETGHSKL